ncbi:unnamed protein product [Protopolystoma xenopodis]|uniref:Ricin B lectin domain-containing protein n=1 Tax=Protopolystoma xenopodis TaxID=117903 RepID=A0A448XGC4_9PLAT|nr:unnamed protein product [Protopolystoma xenopodis]
MQTRFSPQVRHNASGNCLDTMGRKEGEQVGITRCHGLGGHQLWAITKSGELQAGDTGCLEVTSATAPVLFRPCGRTYRNRPKDAQQFQFTGKVSRVLLSFSSL